MMSHADSGLSVQAAEIDALIAAVDRQFGHPYRLRFSRALNARFERDTARERSRRASLGALAGVLLFDLMLGQDWLMFPGDFRQALILRLGVVTPLWLLQAYWIAGAHGVRLRNWVQCACGLVAAGASLMLEASASGGNAAAYQSLTPVTLLFLTLLTTINFGPALILNGIVIGGYAAVLVIGHGFSLSLAFCLLTTHTLVAGFGLAGNWRMHRAERHAYLLTLRETLRAEKLDGENRELLELSHTDALTGAANRRMFDLELQTIWGGDPGGKLSVLLVDVDHFKAYNDRYGHQAGDRCLAAVAAAMQHQLRLDIDLLARYGGEEFGIILPGTDIGDAAMIAERIRRAVEDLAIPHEASAVARHVTISVGFTAGEKGAGRPDRLVNAADTALYDAKQNGRNRIAPPLVVSPERTLAYALAGRRRRAP